MEDDGYGNAARVWQGRKTAMTARDTGWPKSVFLAGNS